MSDEVHQRISSMIREFRPKTKIDDLEDWVEEYGMAAIIHDLILLSIIRARADPTWIDLCNGLSSVMIKLGELDVARRGKRTDP
jgi:hypothetical protein